eukprot:TRINITY_DN11072_c0_g1_i1.p1 TRINITY_DN11072_c0_g1~~TRINITY_DN11072_c0_g1_i1.p1  ORF type:complete len:1206 (-),score=225.61 TRINITY_DN11072_c0_g1_i1:105-3722(-)
MKPACMPVSCTIMKLFMFYSCFMMMVVVMMMGGVNAANSITYQVGYNTNLVTSGVTTPLRLIKDNRVTTPNITATLRGGGTVDGYLSFAGNTLTVRSSSPSPSTIIDLVLVTPQLSSGMYVFTYLNISIEKGSITGGGMWSLAATLSASSITFADDAIVWTSLIATATAGDVIIPSLTCPYNIMVVDISASSRINVAITKIWAGKYTAIATSAAPSVSGQCAQAPSSSAVSGVTTYTNTGTCRSGMWQTLAARAAYVTLNFGSGCSATWKDSESREYIPVSPSITGTPPSLLTRDSQLVTLPKPPSAFDANPRAVADCPHDQSGLLLWHNPATWPSGTVPSPSSSIITIPAGKRVLVSSCSFTSGIIYNTIAIPSDSELIFDDAPITLWVRDIKVQGKLSIGSPTCRMLSYIDIKFFGSKDLSDRMGNNLGLKGIGVDVGGSLDIHGKQFHPTWSRLAATATAGSDRIYLMGQAPNWEVGQQVVVVTSSYTDETTKENEVMTIKAISGNVIQFSSVLRFSHWATQDYQCEVGLLSRRIVLQGDQATSDPLKFGGHVIIKGRGRVSGTQFLRMGQQNVLARYPLHFHMLLASCPSCFSKDNAFYLSYYRCISVHGTHNVEVLRNVAFDISGHCMYLEDGIEENNTLSYNLVAHVHTIFHAAAGPDQIGEYYKEQTDLLIPADIAASGYYITNAYNTISGNAASGGWAGYAFPNLFLPMGPSASLPGYAAFVPAARTTLVFDGNTVHSSGYYWRDSGGIYCGGNFYKNATDGLRWYHSGRKGRVTKTASGEDAFMRFTNTKAWLLRAGVAHWGARIEVINLETYDCVRAALLFGKSWLDNAIVTGRTLNPTPFPLVSPFSSPNGNSWQGFQFYDTGTQTILTDVQFRRYFANGNIINPHLDNRVIISMTHSDQFKPQGISATRNISFVDVPRSQVIGNRLQNTGSSRYYNFIDWDGSLVQRTYAALVATNNSWWYLGTDCIMEPDWAVWVCKKTPAREIATLKVTIKDLIDIGVPFNTGTPPLGDTTYYCGNSTLFDDTGISSGRSTVITRNVGITGCTNKGWYLYFYHGSPLFFEVWPEMLPPGLYVLLALSYPAGTTFNIKTVYDYGHNQVKLNYQLTAALSVSEVRSSDGTKYYFDGQHLYLGIADKIQHALPPTPTAFERGGVTLYNQRYGFHYIITATGCTVSKTVGATQYCSAPYKKPLLF